MIHSDKILKRTERKEIDIYNYHHDTFICREEQQQNKKCFEEKFIGLLFSFCTVAVEQIVSCVLTQVWMTIEINVEIDSIRLFIVINEYAN